MFDLFRKKTAKEFMDEAKEAYIQPEEKKKEPSVSYYRLGLTSDNRVSLSMGYSEITMDVEGVNGLIATLIAFRDQLPQQEKEPEEEPTND